MDAKFEQPTELKTSRGEKIYSGSIYDDVNAVSELISQYLELPADKLQFKLVTNGNLFYAAMQALTHQEILREIEKSGTKISNAVHVEITHDDQNRVTIALTAQENDGQLYNFIRLYKGIFELIQKASALSHLANPIILIYCSPHMSMPIELKLDSITNFSDIIKLYVNFPGRYMHLAS